MQGMEKKTRRYNEWEIYMKPKPSFSYLLPPSEIQWEGELGGTTDVSISLFQKSLNYNYSPKYS